jgi:hypothetical protein
MRGMPSAYFESKLLLDSEGNYFFGCARNHCGYSGELKRFNYTFTSGLIFE